MQTAPSQGTEGQNLYYYNRNEVMCCSVLKSVGSFGMSDIFEKEVNEVKGRKLMVHPMRMVCMTRN